MSDNIENMMQESGVPALPEEEVAFQPSYRIDAETRIPVSKKLGALWKSRIDAELARRKVHVDGWDEAIRYYNNNQQPHREGSTGQTSGNRYFAIRKGETWTETENLVYANVTIAVPAVYAKNPNVEFTHANAEHKDFVQTLEELVNQLGSMQNKPGLNMMMHGEIAVTTAELTNTAWAEYGFVDRAKSAESIQQEIAALSEEYANAKDEKELREIEGKLMALEEEADIVSPPGPFVRIHLPHNVIPIGSTLPDHSDAKAIAVREYYPTAYLNARYGEKRDDGRYYSIYEPTCVLTGTSRTEEMYSVLTDNAQYQEYGYSNKQDYERALYTECFRIWDRTTRRVLLYACNKWDWPIWVEDDPYGLPNFAPLEPLYYTVTPGSSYARSPVTYYLDQADAVNDIHSEFNRARRRALDNILFDDRLAPATVEAALTNTGKKAARGITVPNGEKLADLFYTPHDAILRAQHLFDPQRLYASMDRVSGITDTMRGVQFKTNTTNQAIESYQSSTATRLDKKISAIENWLGRLYYGIAFVCALRMQQSEVEAIIGRRAEAWTNYSPAELRRMFNVQAVGGSTQKPSSEAKKAMALEQSRILASIADKAPITSVKIILTMMKEAFDDFPIPEGTFDALNQEIEMAMQRGNSVQGAQGGGAEGVAPQSPELGLNELALTVDNLPPGAKMALGQALAEGLPVAQVLPEIIRLADQEGQM